MPHKSDIRKVSLLIAAIMCLPLLFVLPDLLHGQIQQPVTSATPSGPCGGDLSGTYPNCTVASIGAKAISLAGALTHAGAFATTITATATTNFTLPAGTHTGAITDAGQTFTGTNNFGVINGSSDINAGITGAIYWASRTKMLSGADGSLGITNLGGTVGANVNLGAITTFTNCASAASPAVCGTSASGRVNIAVAATTVVVNTTAVTAASEIQLTSDASLGTALGVTCNTTPITVGIPTVSARSAGVSFTLLVTGTVGTNPACFSYAIRN